jgi:hypothetical protein
MVRSGHESRYIAVFPEIQLQNPLKELLGHGVAGDLHEGDQPGSLLLRCYEWLGLQRGDRLRGRVVSVSHGESSTLAELRSGW